MEGQLQQQQVQCCQLYTNVKVDITYCNSNGVLFFPGLAGAFLGAKATGTCTVHSTVTQIFSCVK